MPLYTSPSPQAVAQRAQCFRRGMHLIKPLPDRLDARFPVAATRKEAADPGDETDDFVQVRRRGRHFKFVQQMGAANLVGFEEQGCVQSGQVRPLRIK